MDINAVLGETDVTIAEVANQLIRLRGAAGGLSLAQSDVRGAKRQAGIALLTSALDLGAAMGRLCKCDPLHSWVAAHLLHRPQFEHFMRGCFFVGPATPDEAEAFVREDRMPIRKAGRGKKTPITLTQITAETSAYWGGGAVPSAVLNGTKSDMHGLVHGGKVIVDVYTHGDSVGANKATPEQVAASLNNALVLSCLALQSLVTLSDPGEASEAAQAQLVHAQRLLAKMRPLADAELGPRSGE
nr:hypothetical protein [uncultured Pseudoxanthomonas sp.]